MATRKWRWLWALAALGLVCLGCETPNKGERASNNEDPAKQTPPPSNEKAREEMLPDLELVEGASKNGDLAKLRLPKGFSADYYIENLEGARQMARSPSGTIFVGTRRTGKVYAIQDKDGDHKAETRYTLATGLNMPNGVVFHKGALYVAEIGRILRYDNIESKLDNPPKPVVVTDAFPEDRHHGWKYLALGPDTKLYVPVGAPCNVCERDEEIYSTLTRVDLDGKNLEIVARGVRNTVGFGWHPQTGELWFTDNGRDRMGDNRPPDELNRLSKVGQHFGFPYCHGGTILDPKLGGGKKCADYVKPAQNLGPHVAALGLLFYTGEMFPPEYKRGVFIAEHGSWNRSIPIGYRITFVPLGEDGKQARGYHVFAEGWLQGEDRWGRPVALLQLPDGSLLVSDDDGGSIVRITYSAPDEKGG